MMRLFRPNPQQGNSNADAVKMEYRLVKQFFASIALACCMLDASAQNVAPTVSLDALPATVAAPGTIALNASASDADGTVGKVEFFNGTALLATVTQAPYSYQWTGVVAGTYAITARVTDNLGAQAVTPASTVTVASGAAQVYYIYSDQINTAKEIVNAAGAKVWQSDTEPFGANPPNENLAGQGQFTYNQRFPGQYFDRETGLHYNYHRDYDPQTGRYAQSDPIGLEGGINTYGYVAGNPVTFVDPDGLQVKGAVGRLIVPPVPPPIPLVEPFEQPLPAATSSTPRLPSIPELVADNFYNPSFSLPSLVFLIDMCMASERERKRCEKVKNVCIQKCSSETLPTKDYGMAFAACVNRCMEANGCKAVSAGGRR